MTSINKIYLQSGQLIVTESPTELITTLGSCVSVCLWDKKLKIGGMNHFLLPESLNGISNLNIGLTATKMLIKSMLIKMASMKNLEAKVFGGGNRFFASNFLVVGPKNVKVAKRVLEEMGIPVVLYDTGGQSGRKIYFNTQTGNVKVSMVNLSTFQ